MATHGTVEIEVDGVTYRGSYTVEGRPPVITVSCVSPSGSETTQVGTMTVADIAQQLLSEIVHAGLKRQKAKKK